MAMTPAQKQKKMEKETNQIDKATIILIIAVLVGSIVIGVTIGKLLYDIAISTA